MSIGTIGVNRPSDVSINDISIYYSYTPNRETLNNTILPLNAGEVLSYNYLPPTEQISGNENILEGLYTLKLPATVFNQIGFYTIYIKPKFFYCVVNDCSVLSSLPNMKGIVVDVNSLPSALRSNNGLQGYRIEYINIDGTKMRNVIRYVTSNNKVTPISSNQGSSSQRSIRYTYDDSGSLMFLELTPSSASNTKPNITPFIGNPGQTIIISNTFFTPLSIEVELTDVNLESIMTIVGGDQIKDVTKGIVSWYDKNHSIVQQADLYEIKDSIGGVPLFEVKSNRSNIDTSEDFNTITNF